VSRRPHSNPTQRKGSIEELFELEGAEFAQFLQRIEKKSKPRWRYAIRKRDGSLLRESDLRKRNRSADPVERQSWPLLLPGLRRATAIARRFRGAKVERYADYVPETRGRKRGTSFRFRGNEKLTKSLGRPFKAGPDLDEAINRATARYLLLPPEHRPRGYGAWARFLDRPFGRVFSPRPTSGCVVAVSRKKRAQMRVLTQEIQRRAREIERSQTPR
jgi:hypothetical protein